MEVVFSVGLATPLVIEQATTRTAAITTRISKSVTRLVDSGANLAKHSDELATLFRKARALLADAKPIVHGHVGGNGPTRQAVRRGNRSSTCRRARCVGSLGAGSIR